MCKPCRITRRKKWADVFSGATQYHVRVRNAGRIVAVNNSFNAHWQSPRIRSRSLLKQEENQKEKREKNTQLSSKPAATKINLLEDTTVTVDVLSQLSELSLNLQLLCLWTKFYGVNIQMKPGTIYLVCSSNVWVCDEILWCDHSNENPLFGNTFTWYYLSKPVEDSGGTP